ncbi:MAG: ImmA/IrrE family metallo-endopeptidase [Acidobacteria bacterium]|nr:ImmA/IrrE family metallo-endopeptidase [Acidobacteriota bacterium]
MERVDVEPELLRWARQRAGLGIDALAGRFPKLNAWERGEIRPTLKQLERFSKATFTPIGCFFLREVPVERVPIPDFRTVAGEGLDRPSANLLDTIYLCQQRQDWYREFVRSAGIEPVDFVGSSQLDDDISEAAVRIRRFLGFDIEERRRLPTWTDALRRFIGQADARGVLVMVSGVVGSNSRRSLDPQEFRGFALADPTAPLIFINGKDTKAAQMFTLAHELAHLWLGSSGVSDVEAAEIGDQETERWCNRVAAELLVPLLPLKAEYSARAPLSDELNRLARRFKVSTLVILRRIHDAGFLTRHAFRSAYAAEIDRLGGLPGGKGGDFYLTLGARVSQRFARAIVTSTLEGQTSFSESFRLLGFRKMETFSKLANNLGLGF